MSLIAFLLFSIFSWWPPAPVDKGPLFCFYVACFAGRWHTKLFCVKHVYIYIYMYVYEICLYDFLYVFYHFLIQSMFLSCSYSFLTFSYSVLYISAMYTYIYIYVYICIYIYVYTCIYGGFSLIPVPRKTQKITFLYFICLIMILGLGFAPSQPPPVRPSRAVLSVHPWGGGGLRPSPPPDPPTPG